MLTFLCLSSRRASFLLVLGLWLWPGPAVAQTGALEYTLRFPAPHTHYVHVEARVPTGGQSEIELMMAVWTPGSYLVREYSRNVEDMTARTSDGKSLEIDKSRKNRWRISTAGRAAITVSYRVYSREMGVRSNWVEADFAMLNGAPTFVTLAGTESRPHDVQVVLPAGWKTSITGLPEKPAAGPHTYRAADFDTLVDSPIVVGNPAVYEFEVDGVKHYLANVGEGGIWDGPGSAGDVEKIVREHRRMWGFIPYEKYVFLNMITEAGGGLEHRNSTMLMTSRWRTRTRQGYLGWLGLVSHEFFHAWNVKRLRPIELGPFDYEHEVYTTSLWIAEGFTDYYGNLALVRSGLASRDEFLTETSRTIESLQTTPGRLVQPVDMASYDTWIKLYRPDENSANTAISYYTKGEVIAFLLDARIRKATNGQRSLDDLMRLAYKRYAGPKGYTPEQFRATAEELAGTDLKDWFRRTIETTEELDYAEALDWFGLQFRNESENSPTAWLGLITRIDNGRLIVSQVRRGTPGYDAGFNVDDEILATGDYRVRADQWRTRLDQYKPGDKIEVLVARRERLIRLPVTFGNEPANPWRLTVVPTSTTQQEAHRKAWIAGGVGN